MSLPPCPSCQSVYTYQDRDNLVCPECGHEWHPNDTDIDTEPSALDANGATLIAADKVTLIKDLKVKGSSIVLKIGEMMLTAKFVKKA